MENRLVLETFLKLLSIQSRVSNMFNKHCFNSLLWYHNSSLIKIIEDIIYFCYHKFCLKTYSLDTGRKLNVQRRSEDVLDVFWTSFVRSIYVLCPGGTRYSGFYYMLIRSVFSIPKSPKLVYTDRAGFP